MPEDSLDKVRAGLRRGTFVIAALFGSASLAYFAIYLWFSVVVPVYSLDTAFIYLAVDIALTVSVILYQARYSSPRILAFVKSLSSRVREAQYVPYGTGLRGLTVAFDNGLFLTVPQNALGFRLFLAPDGAVLRPTLAELRSVSRGFRKAKRRGTASTRKGDAWMKSELDRICALLGSRSGVVILFEKLGASLVDPSAGKWTSVGIFFTPKWAQQGDAVCAAVDDIARLLEQARTGLALR